jgi:plastocyanin
MPTLIRGLMVVALLSVFALPFARPNPASAEDTNLELHAKLLQFDQKALSVSAGANVTVTLINEDLLVSHDFAIDVPGIDASTACSGRCTTTLTFTAPASGVYKFYCTKHPDQMTGELDVN